MGYVFKLYCVHYSYININIIPMSLKSLPSPNRGGLIIVSCVMKYLLSITVFYLQDGLYLVTNSIDLVSGYPLAVLTPNVNEYKRLVQKVLNCEVNDEESSAELLSLVKG